MQGAVRDPEILERIPRAFPGMTILKNRTGLHNLSVRQSNNTSGISEKSPEAAVFSAFTDHTGGIGPPAFSFFVPADPFVMLRMLRPGKGILICQY